MPLKDIPPNLRFLLLTLLTNAISFGIIVPVTPQLVQQLGHVNLSQATAIGSWMALVYAAFQFVFSPVLGNLSDRFGRRPVLLVALFGLGLEFALMALAPNLFWLFVARALTGLCGAANTPAQSAVGDVAPSEQRTQLFGLLGAAFGVGFIVGPALGGLLGEIGVKAPFIAAALLAFANLTYGLFACEETLKPENRRAFDWKRANPLGSLLQVRKLTGILPIASVYFLWQVASLVYPLLWNYFAEARFGWSSGMIGVSLAVIGLFMACTNIWINPRVTKRFGVRRTAVIGMSFGAAAMFAYAVIPWGWMVIPVGMLMAIGSLSHPALTAMMSARATATTQGEVQGFASSVMGLGSLIAPIALGTTQAWFTSGKAGFYFDGAGLALAGLIAIGAVAAMLAIRDEVPKSAG